MVNLLLDHSDLTPADFFSRSPTHKNVHPVPDKAERTAAGVDLLMGAGAGVHRLVMVDLVNRNSLPGPEGLRTPSGETRQTAVRGILQIIVSPIDSSIKSPLT